MPDSHRGCLAESAAQAETASMQLTGTQDHREGGVNMRFLAQMMVRRTPRETRVNRPSLRKS